MNRISILLVAIAIFSCDPKNETKISMTAQPYGSIDGKEVLQYTLQNKSGMIVKVINYGCTITDIIVPGDAIARAHFKHFDHLEVIHEIL